MSLPNTDFISISSIKFDNEPFIRSLTASIVFLSANNPDLELATQTKLIPAPPSYLLSWVFDDTTIWATQLDGTPYTSNTSFTAGQIGTLIFYLTAGGYDPALEPFTLLTQTIEAAYRSSVDLSFNEIISLTSYDLVYDTFPNIPTPTLFLNYENTSFSNLFYREVSSDPYNFNFAALINEYFLNKINYVLKSQNFADPLWTPTNITVYPDLCAAPNNTITATLLVPITGTPYNSIKEISDIQNDQFPRASGIYNTTSDDDLIKDSDGFGAKFNINILEGIVNSVTVIDGGQNYNDGDLIRVNNSFFPGGSSNDPQLYFTVSELDNIAHEIQQTVILSAGIHNFSLYAFPSGDGRYIYFRSLNYGDIIFDLYGANTYNYGLWQLEGVTLTNPEDLFLSAFDLGNNWVRCSASLNISAVDTIDFNIGITSTNTSIYSDADENHTIFIWGAQIEPATTSTAYVSTDSTIFTQKYNNTYLAINNNPTPITTIDVNTTLYTSICSFLAPIPCTSSIQIVISANSTFNSLTSWYTPHIFVNSISAKFIPEFLQADFIGYTSIFFNESGTGLPVDSFNYTTTNGLCFYGEGHTEIITLSAPIYNNNPKYFWNFDDINTNVYENEIGVAGTSVPLITSLTKDLVVKVPTTIGYYPSIPISLFVTNDFILSSGPIYKLNDNTGNIEPYPFYYSTTLNTSGTEFVSPYLNPNNNLYKRNIEVVSFAPLITSYSSNLNDEILLPIGTDRSGVQILSAELVAALFGGGAQSIDRCYDKYNIVWKWSNLEGWPAVSATNPQSFSNKPSSWADTQCTLAAGRPLIPGGPPPKDPVSGQQGKYSKRWRFEGFNIDDGIIEPEYCTATTIIWTVSTSKWVIDTEVPITEKRFEFPLTYFGNGTNFYTASLTENTDIVIRGQQTVNCTICAFPFDWGTRTTFLLESSKATILSRGDFRFYTNNRFVLVNEEVKFENLSKGFNNVIDIVIDFGDNILTTLSENDLYNNFVVTYTTPGYKTLTVTINYTNGSTLIEKYENIINVVTEYDVVEPKNYRTPKTEVMLPWPNKPYIAPNEWVTENNINSVIKKFYENLQYLDDRGRVYYDEPVEYYGWLGGPVSSDFICPIWTWEDIECATNFVFENSAIEIGTLWTNVECIDTNFPDITANGSLAQCGTWEQHFRESSKTSSYNPDCFGRHCIEWKWKYRRSNNLANIVQWKNTKFGEVYEKKWYSEPCITLEGDVITGLNCNDGFWQVNIPKINDFYDPIPESACLGSEVCAYRNITTFNDLIIVALPSQIKVLSSEYDPTFVGTKRTIDDFFAFKNIKNLEFDSTGKLFVLDGSLNRVVAYDFDITETTPWVKILDWGGFGSSNSRNKYSSPNDLHIDNLDNVWIADTGNNCIKHYTNSGTWIQTIKYFEFTNNTPTSIVLDSENRLHALVGNKIIVFSYTGEYLFEYILNEFVDTTPLRLSVNRNREIIYVISSNKVGKYFKNGAFAGNIVQDKNCAQNITSVHQDKNRNVLVTSGEKILKYVDPMRIKQLKGDLPANYWKLNDLLIHKDEYVQDWVYNKAFQRLWDNIEIFRRTLIFELDSCQQYVPPVHTKDKISIGQNEIVTAASVNRIIDYLWENFVPIVEYFDPACLYKVLEQEKQKEQKSRQVDLTFAGVPGSIEYVTPTIST
jgi:hypothetical protein